jgi:hypothetical protein
MILPLPTKVSTRFKPIGIFEKAQGPVTEYGGEEHCSVHSVASENILTIIIMIMKDFTEINIKITSKTSLRYNSDATDLIYGRNFLG